MADGETTETSLTIRRVFDAPRERVWSAWTDPDEIEQWLRPEGFSVDFAEGDVRPGGAWRSGMRSPDGDAYVVGGEYHEVVEPERLVFTHAWEDEGEQDHETLVTVILATDGERTELTFRQEGLTSVESRDSHEEGWNGVLENLSDHLRAHGSSTEIPTENDGQ
jgi:uncharacterized protein YndB with AHSA1/START domain